MGCASSADVGANSINAKGNNLYGIKLPKRPLEGKQTKETIESVAEIEPAMKALPVEDQLYTESNIADKRMELEGIAEWIVSSEQAFHDEVQAKVDMTTFTVPSSDGYAVEVFVYTPKAIQGQKGPGYLYARGGGACMGEAKDSHHLMYVIANNLNCVVFNVGFRNGPEVKCPQGQQDFAAVVRYVNKNGDQFGVDPNKICISGTSGGIWIAAGAANLMAKAGDLNIVKAFFLQQGMLSNEMANLNRDNLTDYERYWSPNDIQMTCFYKLHTTEAAFNSQINDDQLYPGKASDAILQKYPPTIIWTCEFDVLKRDCQKFAMRLQKNGKLIDIGTMPGVMHGYNLYNFTSQEVKWFYEEEKMAFDAIFRS